MTEDPRRRQIVELECGDCLVVIDTSEQWRTREGHLESGFVAISLFHPGEWKLHDSLKKRLKRVWHAWRRETGDAGSVWIETLSDKSLDGLIGALIEARNLSGMTGQFKNGVYELTDPAVARSDDRG